MNKYLAEAKRIGDQLISEAKSDKTGIYWETTNIGNGKKKIIWSISEGIYAGTSGIILFFIELFRQTKEKKYLETAEQAMAWTISYSKQNKTHYYALFTGRMGVSFACLKLYEITKKKKYLTHALAIAKPTIDHVQHPRVFDLINGISGTLLGLIHLHAMTKEPWVLDHIAAHTQKLLDSARWSKSGLYWETGHSQSKPLCGFSHGSGGIGFVFLELAHYFDNPAFAYVAEQAFMYENHHYNEKLHNWPDFRVNLYYEEDMKEFEKKYLDNDLESFTTQIDANQWCHGAAGIGLARLRWYELFKNSTALNDTKKAIERTLQHDHGAFTLCHGIGGNMELFLEAYPLLGNMKLLENANAGGDEALKQVQQFKKYYSGMKYDKENEPEDRSLFNGIAGIGYFFLRLQDTKRVPSILAPKVDAINTSNKLPEILQANQAKIRQILFSNMFGRTMKMVESLAPKKVETFLKSTKVESFALDTFIDFAIKLHPTLPADNQNDFAENFNLEHKKFSMFEECLSSSYTFIRERIFAKDAKKYMKRSDTKLGTQSFVLSPAVTFVTLSNPKASYLLRLTPYNVEELEVSEFCEIVLRQFEEKQDVKHAVENVVKLYGVTSKEDIAMVKEKVIAQIHEGIQNGILIS